MWATSRTAPWWSWRTGSSRVDETVTVTVTTVLQTTAGRMIFATLRRRTNSTKPRVPLRPVRAKVAQR